MDQIHLDPQDKLPPYPPPLGHIVNKTPSTHRTKKCLRPPPLPEDNFWNSPKAPHSRTHNLYPNPNPNPNLPNPTLNPKP